jgi:hypothetical protein
MSVSKAAAELGRIGGSVTSKKKAETARENGKRGGRPVGSKDRVKRKIKKPRTKVIHRDN